MNSIDQILMNREEVSFEIPTISKTKEFSLKNINIYFILTVIFAFEVLVCFIGASFYTSIGYNLSSALVMAIVVEVFYMYFSSKRDLKSNILKTLLLLISVTTLCYSAYTKDVNVIAKEEGITSEINEYKQISFNLSKDLIDLRTEKMNIEKDMEVFRKFDKATKGNLILGPRRLELNQKRQEILTQKEKTLQKLKSLNQAQLKQGPLNNISILTIKTIITILLFTTIQISICLALPDLIIKLQKLTIEV